MLLSVLWAFSIFVLMPGIKTWKILSHHLFRLSLCFVPSFLSVIIIRHMLVTHDETALWFWDVFFFSFPFFLLYFCLFVYWCVFKLSYPFLDHVQSVDEPIKNILQFCYRFWFVVGYIFWLFLQTSISMPTLPNLMCVLSSFSVKTLNIFITVILYFLYDHSDYLCHIWVWFWCFVPPNCVFSCHLACLVIFNWNSDIMYWVIGIEAKKNI